MVLASEWGVGQVLWSMIWFFMFFLWIWLLIAIFADIFRSHDLGGLAKALWVIFVIVTPFLGVLVYMIARGHKMSEHAMESAQAQDAAARAYIQNTVATSSPSDEITRLADLKAQGVITDAEFQQMKSKVVAAWLRCDPLPASGGSAAHAEQTGRIGPGHGRELGLRHPFRPQRLEEVLESGGGAGE